MATASVVARMSEMRTAVVTTTRSTVAATAVVAATAMMTATAVVTAAAVVTATSMVAATVASLGLGQGGRQSQGRQDQTCRPNRPQQWHFHGAHDVLLGKQFI